MRRPSGARVGSRPCRGHRVGYREPVAGAEEGEALVAPDAGGCVGKRMGGALLRGRADHEGECSGPRSAEPSPPVAVRGLPEGTLCGGL
ncbi:hypothetical protein EES39_39725 [Streptomyces sp. ADI92-24]|nr:hypothetical protein EDD95_6059 [Streptomyces sp. CEV 2-1]RPK31945.1 hypothetical protein EES39_39725 [Streptomyces sp. ADI92-24]